MRQHIRRTLILLVLLGVGGSIALWPQEESPFHGWPGLVDIAGKQLDFTPRYGANDPASISTGEAANWGRATDQDGKPLAGATVTAYLVVHFGHGHGPKHWMVQFRVAEDGTFTVAGGSGIMLTITVAKPGHTPYLRRFELHPEKERFRPTKDAPEELICWQNVGQGKRQAASMRASVPWPLCQHFRLDFLQRKVVGPEEPGDLEIQLPLTASPFVDGKLEALDPLGTVQLTAVDGAYGFCEMPYSRVYTFPIDPFNLPWQPSERHPQLVESSIGGPRSLYCPFVTLTFESYEARNKSAQELRFGSRHSEYHQLLGREIFFHSRKGQVVGKITLRAIFDLFESQGKEGYFVRVYGTIAQGPGGWNEREPEPELLLPDPEP